MALDGVTPFEKIITILEGLPNMDRVFEGIPEAVGGRVSAYCALSGHVISDKPHGQIHRIARYVCALVYRVAQAESGAERKLLEDLDEFERTIYANRTLDGTCQSIELDMTLSERPEYQTLAGMEYREFPFAVLVRQIEPYQNTQQAGG